MLAVSCVDVCIDCSTLLGQKLCTVCLISCDLHLSCLAETIGEHTPTIVSLCPLSDTVHSGIQINNILRLKSHPNNLRCCYDNHCPARRVVGRFAVLLTGLCLVQTYHEVTPQLTCFHSLSPPFHYSCASCFFHLQWPGYAGEAAAQW